MSNNLNMLGSKIRNLREDADLTQKELSSQLGLTPKMISFYENNQRTPPIDVLVKLASIFHVSLDYLVGINAQKNVSQINNSHLSWEHVRKKYPYAIIATPEIHDLIEYYEQLSIKDKRWIMGQMIDLIKKSEEQKEQVPRAQ